jgi:hypothetical protein
MKGFLNEFIFKALFPALWGAGFFFGFISEGESHLFAAFAGLIMFVVGYVAAHFAWSKVIKESVQHESSGNSIQRNIQLTFKDGNVWEVTPEQYENLQKVSESMMAELDLSAPQSVISSPAPRPIPVNPSQK